MVASSREKRAPLGPICPQFPCESPLGIVQEARPILSSGVSCRELAASNCATRRPVKRVVYVCVRGVRVTLQSLSFLFFRTDTREVSRSDDIMRFAKLVIITGFNPRWGRTDEPFGRRRLYFHRNKRVAARDPGGSFYHLQSASVSALARSLACARGESALINGGRRDRQRYGR